MSSEPPRTERIFFREAIARAVRAAMLEHPTLTLLGQDVGAFGGSYKEFAGLLSEFGADRVRDTPVAEAAMVGVGAGAAAAGRRCLVSLTYMDFALLALDPLVNYAAKARFKTGGQLRVPLVVKMTAGAKGQGVVHSQSFDAWLMSVPGLRVVAPSNVADAYGLMRTALNADGPVVYIDHKRLFPGSGELPSPPPEVPFGSAVIRRPGRDVTIVTHSYMTGVVLDAARTLEQDGITSTVVDLRSLAPLDMTTVCDAVAATGRLLTVEEGQTTCGVGSEVIARTLEALGPLPTARLGARPVPVSSNPVLEEAALPNAAAVAAAVRRLLDPAFPNQARSS